ncbi:phospholipase A [Marinobacter sp.]|uniref:phospholipase A n=1 Tax=Marinobacter sp. TaxID=50741 RepID=UPI00384A68FC
MKPIAKYLALAVALATSLASAQGRNLEGNEPDLEDCALISSGVRRLACYDHLTEPQEARENASEKEIEAAEEATANLGINQDGEVDETADVKSDEEDSQDEDAGVMKAFMERYVATEKALFSFSGSFVTHRPTYILPVTHAHEPNQTPSSPTLGTTTFDERLDDEEAKYQISFKIPLLTGVLDDRTTLWFGYTQLSFWQVYNNDSSKPFRETNYDVEIFARYQANMDFGPITLSGASLGISHQSNGRSEPQSRSWNRLTGSFVSSYDRWLFMLNPWYRIPEDSKDDDNPDIEKYLGHGDFWAVYKWSESKTLSLKLRNNLRTGDNKTSIQLGYSFPMGGDLKGYVQYYDGYGESLIDYNERIQRIGVGVMLNDWL